MKQSRSLLLVLACVACSGDAAENAAPPAKVENAVKETDLTTVKLSAEAVKQLAIAIATVDSVVVARTRTLGGEVLVPPGRALTIAAPVAGAILAPEGGDIPVAGSGVVAGQPLFRIVGLPADHDLLRTDEDLTIAQVRLRQAQQEAERIARLYADKLVSARENERAQADYAAARAQLDAAAARQAMVRSGTTDSRLAPLLIRSPSAGVLWSLHAGVGQTVAAGAPLAEIVPLNRLWIRVPVYAGEAHRYARDVAIVVHGLGAPGQSGVRARPITAPPSANAQAASVDLYYEVERPAGLRPGERVSVTLPLIDPPGRALTVPLAAIVHDLNGGAWVYEQLDATTFARRRVEVERVVGDKAVLTSGPAPGTRIVTDGAAELFGVEFGIGK